MADYQVNITWENGSIQPDPQPVLAQAGDTIQFVLVQPPDGELTIQFDEPALFSAPVFKLGDEPVKVGPLVHETFYKCNVMIAGQSVAQGQPGGSVKPPKG
jgi:hypothetical protein